MTTTTERFEREYIEFNGLSHDRHVRSVRTLREFEELSGKPAIECGATEMRAYLSHLLDQDLSPNTISQRATMLRTFFGWAFDVGLVSGDTLMAVKRVPDPKGASRQNKPNPYTPKELKQFWADLDKTWPYVTDRSLKMWRNGTSQYRNIWRHGMRLQLEAIIRLALDCGMRRNEIFGASLDDLHPDNFYIVVHGKRETVRVEKVREVPFTKQARVAVERWLNFRSELLRRGKVKDCDAVWLSLRNPRPLKPMRQRRFDTIVATFGPYRLHRLRHTCATNWLRAGVEIEVVSRMLGHSNITQTLGYAEIIREDIHAAMHKHEDAFEALANAEEAA